MITKYILDEGSLRELIQVFGEEHQLTKAIEELTELSLELQHHIRGGNERKIIEEIADVSIVLDQLYNIFACGYDLEVIRKYKINRALERVKKQKPNQRRNKPCTNESFKL